MDRIQAKQAALDPIIEPNHTPAYVLIALGVLAGAGACGGYYTGKFSGNIALLSGAVSATVTGYGSYRRLTQKPVHRVKLALERFDAAEKDQAKLERSSYELGRLIMQTDWSNVEFPKDKKALATFEPKYEGATLGLGQLFAKLPDEVADKVDLQLEYMGAKEEEMGTPNIPFTEELKKAYQELKLGEKGSGESQHTVSVAEKKKYENLMYLANGANRVLEYSFEKGKDDQHLTLVIQR